MASSDPKLVDHGVQRRDMHFTFNNFQPTESNNYSSTVEIPHDHLAQAFKMSNAAQLGTTDGGLKSIDVISHGGLDGGLYALSMVHKDKNGQLTQLDTDDRVISHEMTPQGPMTDAHHFFGDASQGPMNHNQPVRINHAKETDLEQAARLHSRWQGFGLDNINTGHRIFKAQDAKGNDIERVAVPEGTGLHRLVMNNGNERNFFNGRYSDKNRAVVNNHIVMSKEDFDEASEGLVKAFTPENPWSDSEGSLVFHMTTPHKPSGPVSVFTSFERHDPTNKTHKPTTDVKLVGSTSDASPAHDEIFAEQVMSATIPRQPAAAVGTTKIEEVATAEPVPAPVSFDLSDDESEQGN